jgi:hypothetical protein
MARLERYLIAAVLAHLVVVLIHTVSHLVLQILPQPPDAAFILFVILIGPVAALPILRFNRTLAGALLAVLMASAFVYGFQSHFLAEGPDHVALVAGNPWTDVFAVTAAILGALELLTALLGIAVVFQVPRRSWESAERRP